MEENKRQKRIQKRAAQREALALSLEEEDRARARQQAEAAAAAAAATTAGSGASGPATGAVPLPPPPELTKNVSYLLGPGASKRVEVCWWLCGHGCVWLGSDFSVLTLPTAYAVGCRSSRGG